MNDNPQHERFMRLFLENEPEFLRTALIYVPTRNDAREIIQEAAISLWRDFDKFDPSRPFAAWGCGYVRIEVQRFLRDVKRRTLLSVRAADVLAATESRVTQESEARHDALRNCLGELPAEQRQLINGYYVGERSVTSLASEQSRTVDAVYKALQRIRHVLLACIEGKLAETCD